MSDDSFMLKPIKDILNKSFNIPKYQRGYRWGKQQIEDLLNDIEKSESNQCYCLQPLVVAERFDSIIAKKPEETINENNEEYYKILKNETKECSTKYDVIDGQQRLTTIYIILKVLQNQYKIQINNLFKIEYESRKDSAHFLDAIKQKQEQDAEKNIDFYHMWQCYRTVKEWFQIKTSFQNKTSKEIEYFKNKLLKIEDFKNKLLEKVNFIWYVDDSGNPVNTFTRLNIGKIALTNAELIKAMLLKKSNFNYDEGHIDDSLRLTQLEMATQWDEIEFTLQNDEFWYFIHPQQWSKPTRIDFIFDLIKDLDLLANNKNTKGLYLLETNNKNNDDFGNDNYTTFRYFYHYLNRENNNEPYKTIWEKVRCIFQIFREWFNDLTLYHYIGFLTNNNEPLANSINQWKVFKDENENTLKKEKDIFKKYLITRIKQKLNDKLTDNNEHNTVDLSNTYSDKCKWRPLLLLFNIQTIINQNKGYVNKYGKGVFYKFPFHLFSKENWDIEHIDPATDNELNNKNDQKEWLKFIYLGLEKDKRIDDIRQDIIDFLGGEKDDFESIQKRIEEKINSTSINNKDTIGNFVLLDSSTNRGYGNSIFPSKRRVIIGKDQGKRFTLNIVKKSNDKNDDDLKITTEDNDTSFIPPCTRNVFMKYYTPNSTDIMAWTQSDAEAYVKQIYETLKIFGVKYTQNND